MNLANIALHITDRTLYTWPNVYWSALVKDLVDKGHTLVVFSDDPHVKLDFKNPSVFTYFCAPDDIVEKAMKNCDIFIGVPLKFSAIAKKYGVKMINLLGSTSKGEGIISPLICQGCIDKGVSEIDCAFQDELCYWRITPIMVNREVDKICAS